MLLLVDKGRVLMRRVDTAVSTLASSIYPPSKGKIGTGCAEQE